MDFRQLQQLQKLLPKVPGINGKEEYFNSAVLVLLMPVNGDYHFVFEKRGPNIRQGGEICFPGGKFDPEADADFAATAVRETVEELGITPEDLRIVGRLDTVISPMGATVDAFLATIEHQELSKLNFNRDEVENVFTIPVSYFTRNEPQVYKVCIKAHPSYVNKEGEEVVLFPAKELGLPDRYSKPWGQGQINIYVYQVKEGVIWGITARLIYDLVKKLRCLENCKM